MVASNYEQLSAEYIGQIVGPKGGSPFITITSLEDVDTKASTPLKEYDETA